MNRIPFDNRGMLLIWLSAFIGISGIFATYWVRSVALRAKSGPRTVYVPSEVAREIECPDECILGNLILSRLKTVIEEKELSDKSLCGLSAENLKSKFNSPEPKLVFPLPTLPIRIESDPDVEYALKGLKSSLAGTPLDFQPELKKVIESCQSIKVPETPLDPGVFKFCVGLDMTGHPDAHSNQKRFPTSQYAMASTEVFLVNRVLSQDQKTLETNQSCSDWSKEISGRHLKFNYQIFWKAYGNSQDYFSWNRSVIVPWYEIRSE
ncbi:MAG: hypothetical protein ACKN9V_04890 [Pseudomonadota bacterium]